MQMLPIVKYPKYIWSNNSTIWWKMASFDIILENIYIESKVRAVKECTGAHMMIPSALLKAVNYLKDGDTKLERWSINCNMNGDWVLFLCAGGTL